MWKPAFAEQNELSGPQQILQQPVFGKEINCLFNRKSIAIVYMEIKVTATQRPLSSFVFYQKRSMCSLKTITDPPIHLSPLYLPPYMVPPGTWTKTNLCS